jgi:hypothetical protein
MSRRKREREKSREAAPPRERDRSFVFTPWTWGFGAAGLATALAGFFLLADGSMTLAPILLVVAFLVFFPIALTK